MNKIASPIFFDKNDYLSFANIRTFLDIPYKGGQRLRQSNTARTTRIIVSTHKDGLRVYLKRWVNISRPAAIWGVATNIFKGTFVIATWAYFWWRLRLNGITATQTLPERIHVFYLSILYIFSHDIILYSIFLNLTYFRDFTVSKITVFSKTTV